jgi:hypothetical protein
MTVELLKQRCLGAAVTHGQRLKLKTELNVWQLEAV